MTTNPSLAQVAPSDEMRARVSALIDGELVGDEHDRAIDALLASDELARFWHDCHRAGDWMRSDEVGACEPRADFMARMVVLLAEEPAIVAPHASTKTTASFWLRTGLPGASIAAAVLVVAWVAIPVSRTDVPATPVATVTQTIQPVVAAPGVQPAVEQVATRTPMDAEQVSDYMAAHSDVSPFAYRGAAARPANFVTPVAGTAR
jgi:negative regulator of sigma E activity